MKPQTSPWIRVPDLDAVTWPDDAVLLCDEAVLGHVPDNLRHRTIAVAAGEGLKTLSAVERLAEQVLALRATRPLTLVAIGGGSVGDAVGFLASVLWRGVELWHVPTTLLAAVDSAHGGKTAVNLGAAKNQLGTFWPATRIIFAEQILAALPTSQRAEGLTELVKALWLTPAADGRELLDVVTVGELAFAPWPQVQESLGQLIDLAVAVKQTIVARDPRETEGIRTWLNLGHTAAHGLELLCGVSHGVAVAWGIAAAAVLSEERVGLPATERHALWRHVHPLLGPVSVTPPEDRFVEVLGRDKKSVGGRLRSVLLRGAGDPVVVDDVRALDWLQALDRVRRELFAAPVDVRLVSPRPAELTLASSKSELNRALVIAAMRGQSTPFDDGNPAEDVAQMRAGIASLQRGETADAGNGGTTFRFLLALAAALPGGGAVRMGPQLARRPHEPLFVALREAGASVVRTEDLVTVGALPDGPVHVRVDARSSSQFASALLLLRASGREVALEFVDGVVASDSYLKMTAAMLEMQPLSVTPDASSAAMWHVFNRLGGAVDFASLPGPLQPDARVVSLLWGSEAPDQTVDLSLAPDLAPVLGAYAALTEPALTIVGAAHLRHKESNRIEDLVAAFGEVGVAVEPRPDGLFVPRGVQGPRAGATFDPRGDHRLAFAALLLATRAPLRLHDPRCVAKSYPRVFEDAQRVGFWVAPAIGGSVTDSFGRSPDT